MFGRSSQVFCNTKSTFYIKNIKSNRNLLFPCKFSPGDFLTQQHEQYSESKPQCPRWCASQRSLLGSLPGLFSRLPCEGSGVAGGKWFPQAHSELRKKGSGSVLLSAPSGLCHLPSCVWMWWRGLLFAVCQSQHTGWLARNHSCSVSVNEAQRRFLFFSSFSCFHFFFKCGQQHIEQTGRSWAL